MNKENRRFVIRGGVVDGDRSSEKVEFDFDWLEDAGVDNLSSYLYGWFLVMLFL